MRIDAVIYGFCPHCTMQAVKYAWVGEHVAVVHADALDNGAVFIEGDRIYFGDDLVVRILQQDARGDYYVCRVIEVAQHDATSAV